MALNPLVDSFCHNQKKCGTERVKCSQQLQTTEIFCIDACVGGASTDLGDGRKLNETVIKISSNSLSCWLCVYPMTFKAV